ncbi:hypothetical protein KFE26_19855 [Shewanella sp. M16]|uniref:hypothetical protein n=1 Tax=Shewanella sp. M16 TaxID=2830837 RepID=UPI001BB0563A|nr:hypothetical protein [Shewanella sp. M16]MBS0044536.1 hypothetical protein [Shewanella sp. M16]QYW06249.1 hypothetical protein MuM162_p08 [Shewanella phage vB_SspM_MuM16-2]
MTDKKLISKAKYMEILNMQLESTGRALDSAKEDYEALDNYIDKLQSIDFEQVEVTQQGEDFSFNIVEKTND